MAVNAFFPQYKVFTHWLPSYISEMFTGILSYFGLYHNPETESYTSCFYVARKWICQTRKSTNSHHLRVFSWQLFFLSIPTLTYAWNETFLAHIPCQLLRHQKAGEALYFPTDASAVAHRDNDSKQARDDSKWQQGQATGNASLSSTVSLLFLDESYRWLWAIIMGIKNRATTLGSIFRPQFQYCVTNRNTHICTLILGGHLLR